MTTTSPFVPIGILGSNMFLISLPQIIIPTYVENELGYNEWIVSVMFMAGFLGGVIGLYVFGILSETYGFVRSCKLCFMINFIGLLFPIIFPENIVINIVSRIVIGMSAIIVVCQVWTGILSDNDPIYMNYLIQVLGIVGLVGLIITSTVDALIEDKILLWRVVYSIGICTSVGTSIFLQFTKDPPEMNVEHTKHDINIPFLARSAFLGNFLCVTMVLGLYVLTVDYEKELYFLVIVLILISFIKMIVSPKLQVYLLSKYDTVESVIQRTALFTTFFMSIGIYCVSAELYSGLVLICIGGVFNTISNALLKTVINQYIAFSPRGIYAYLIAERLGWVVSSMILIPMYKNIHPLSIGALYCVLHFICFYVLNK